MATVDRIEGLDRPRSVFLAGMVSVLHLAVFWLYWMPYQRRYSGDERTYLNAAIDWLQGGPAFVDSLWPPAYAWFLAALQANLILIQCVQYVLLLMVTWLSGRICTHLTDSDRAGWVTTIALLLYPPFVVYAQFLWPELIHLAVMLTGWWFLLCVRNALNPMILVFVAGLCAGLALLFKSVILVFLPFMFILLSRLLPRRKIAGVLLYSVAIVLVLAPVMWGKYQQTGVPYLHTSGLFNVQLGLENTARQWHQDKMGSRLWREYQTLGDDSTARNAELRQQIQAHLGERGFLQTAWDMLVKQPFRILDVETEFTVGRGYANKDGLLHTLLSWWSRAWYVAFMLCVPLAVAQWPRTNRGWWLPLSFALLVCGLLMMMHAKPRFRMVWIPGVTMMVAYWWVALRAHGISQQFSKLRLWQWILIGLITIILVFLATAAPLMDSAYPISG